MIQAALSPSQEDSLPPVPRSQARCESLETQITELSAHIHAATHWLNWKCGINIGAARETTTAMPCGNWTGILTLMALWY
jgi:hypothetical protein